MSQGNGSRRSRGRNQNVGHNPPDGRRPTSLDNQSFWERSNSRMGVGQPTPSQQIARMNSRSPVEYPCSVCGASVWLTRWPKHRHDVVCERCKRDMGQLLAGEPRESRRRGGTDPLAGIPAFTEEDLRAIAEMRSDRASSQGAGTTGNKRGRPRRGGHHGGQGGGQGGQGGQGGGDGGQRRRKHRQPKKSGEVAREREAAAPAKNGDGGQPAGSRRRRRRRRGGGGGGEERPIEGTSSPQSGDSSAAAPG